MKIITIAIWFLFICQTYGIATDYYVDQNHASADDVNPGTEILPLKTIQRGVELAQPGDSVIIKGSPDSDSSKAVYTVSGNGITTVRDGSQGYEIIIKTFNGQKVIIKGALSSGYGISLNNSYIKFYGLTFSGFRKAVEGTAVKKNLMFSGCEFTNTSETGLRLRNIHNLIVRDCYVHHCFEAGISLRGCSNCLFERVESSYNSDELGEAGDGDGFHSLDGDSIDFIDCIARNNSEDGFDLTSNGQLLNCISSGHKACNIKLWRRDTDNYLPKKMTIINAQIYSAGQCGIKITNGPQLRLFCSVIFGNGEEGIAFRGISISEGPDSVESVLVNNIIAGNSKNATWARGIDVQQSDANFNKVAASYNLYYNNKNPNSGLYSDEFAISGEDPLFLNAGEKNFHLSALSPAINTGLRKEDYLALHSLYGVDLSEDYDHNPRPVDDRWDIGAFEYTQTSGFNPGKREIPSVYRLYNYPNPFNPSTTICFDLPRRSRVKIKIYNITGQEIRTLVDGIYYAGTHRTGWDGRNRTNRLAGSGVYYYKLTTAEKIITEKMILLH